MAQEIQTTARLEARLPNEVYALLKRAAEIALAARRVREEILSKIRAVVPFPLGATSAQISLHGLSGSFWCVNI